MPTSIPNPYQPPDTELDPASSRSNFIKTSSRVFIVFYLLIGLSIVSMSIFHELSFQNSIRSDQLIQNNEAIKSTIFSILTIIPIILISSPIGGFLAKSLLRSRFQLFYIIPSSAFIIGIIVTSWIMLLYWVKFLLGYFPPNEDLHLGTAALIMPLVMTVVFSVINGLLVLVLYIKFRRQPNLAFNSDPAATV